MNEKYTGQKLFMLFNLVLRKFWRWVNERWQHFHIFVTDWNKTQYQRCKRLAWSIIPHSLYGLVWMWSLWCSQAFFCVLGHFRHGDTLTNNRTTNRWSLGKPALDQWELLGQSLIVVLTCWSFFYILLKLALGSVVPLTMFCSLFLLQSFLLQTFMFMRFFIICLASTSVSRASHVLIQVLAINNNILSALWHFMINIRS